MKNKLKFLFAVASVSLLTVFATSINVAFGDPSHEPPGTDVAPTFSGVTVTGGAQFDDTITVDGTATFNDTAEFYGVGNFYDSLNVNELTDGDGWINVTGKLYHDGVNPAIYIDDDLAVTGTLYNPDFGKYLDIRDPLYNLETDTPVTIRDDLNLSGDLFDSFLGQGVVINDVDGLEVAGPFKLWTATAGLLGLNISIDEVDDQVEIDATDDNPIVFNDNQTTSTVVFNSPLEANETVTIGDEDSDHAYIVSQISNPSGSVNIDDDAYITGDISNPFDSIKINDDVEISEKLIVGDLGVAAYKNPETELLGDLVIGRSSDSAAVDADVTIWGDVDARRLTADYIGSYYLYDSGSHLISPGGSAIRTAYCSGKKLISCSYLTGGPGVSVTRIQPNLNTNTCTGYAENVNTSGIDLQFFVWAICFDPQTT